MALGEEKEMKDKELQQQLFIELVKLNGEAEPVYSRLKALSEKASSAVLAFNYVEQNIEGKKIIREQKKEHQKEKEREDRFKAKAHGCGRGI
jgi:hypothetical protein